MPLEPTHPLLALVSDSSSSVEQFHADLLRHPPATIQLHLRQLLNELLSHPPLASIPKFAALLRAAGSPPDDIAVIPEMNIRGPLSDQDTATVVRSLIPYLLPDALRPGLSIRAGLHGKALTAAVLRSHDLHALPDDWEPYLRFTSKQQHASLASILIDVLKIKHSEARRLAEHPCFLSRRAAKNLLTC